ncbi:hypothetical protein H5410_043901 [Solanum commersonii]|uniref:Uncharacterized protein n=1 Tax=Solanum commersonii TaxID=4109 RepID=A0A9J5XYG5_SOLCO|nr:hypothetical protein H5410_043901 [Solanum commersonii]
MNFGEEEDSSGIASKRGVLKMINIQSLAMPSLSPAFFTRFFELIIFQRFGNHARPGNLLPGT